MDPKSIVLKASLLLILCAPAFGGGLNAMKLFVRLRFWNVPEISTKDLASWLTDDSRPKPFLLDVRTPAEYAVSHLPGAQRIDPDARITQTLDQFPPDRPIVTYCSVGYRSAELAQRFIAAGRMNIYETVSRSIPFTHTTIAGVRCWILDVERRCRRCNRNP
jgi:rhodanese-related sulfurtransferase